MTDIAWYIQTGQGTVPRDYRRMEICRLMGWTFREYDDTPARDIVRLERFLEHESRQRKQKAKEERERRT